MRGNVKEGGRYHFSVKPTFNDWLKVFIEDVKGRLQKAAEDELDLIKSETNLDLLIIGKERLGVVVNLQDLRSLYESISSHAATTNDGSASVTTLTT